MTVLLVLALCMASALAGYPKYTDYYGPNVYGKGRPVANIRDGEVYGNKPANGYVPKPVYKQEYPLYGQGNKYPVNNNYPQNNNYGAQGGSYPPKHYGAQGVQGAQGAQGVYYPQANAYPQGNYPHANYRVPVENYPQANYRAPVENYVQKNYYPQVNYHQNAYPKTTYPQANYPAGGYYPKNGYPQENNYPQTTYPKQNNQGYYANAGRAGYNNNAGNYPAKTAYPAKDTYAPSKTNFYPPRLVYPIKDNRQNNQLGKRPGSVSKSAFPSFNNFKIPGFAFGKALFN